MKWDNPEHHGEPAFPSLSNFDLRNHMKEGGHAKIDMPLFVPAVTSEKAGPNQTLSR